MLKVSFKRSLIIGGVFRLEADKFKYLNGCFPFCERINDTFCCEGECQAGISLPPLGFVPPSSGMAQEGSGGCF